MSVTNTLLTPQDLASAMAATLEGWTCTDGKLTKTFTFKGFAEAIAFMTRCAFDAQRLDHHPNWCNVYNKVEVELWSHDLGGISQRCVDLATAMDRNGGSTVLR